MSTPKWVRVDPTEVERDIASRKGRGVELRLFLSPYDVPDAVRGRYDSNLGRFVIEFRYIQEEEWERDEHHEYITLRLGKNSRRILGIEIDVDRLKADHIKLDLRRMVGRRIRKIAKSGKRRVPQGNYDAAIDILHDKEREVLEELKPVG